MTHCLYILYDYSPELFGIGFYKTKIEHRTFKMEKIPIWY